MSTPPKFHQKTRKVGEVRRTGDIMYGPKPPGYWYWIEWSDGAKSLIYKDLASLKKEHEYYNYEVHTWEEGA